MALGFDWGLGRPHYAGNDTLLRRDEDMRHAVRCLGRVIVEEELPMLVQV